MQSTEAIAVVHIKDDGSTDFLLCGDERFRLFVVDERAPNDRVYEMTQRDDPEVVRAILGDDPIGSCRDSRSAAIAARVSEMVGGTPRLTIVE